MKSRTLYFSWLFIAVVAASVGYVALTNDEPASGGAASDPAASSGSTAKQIAWNKNFEDAMKQAKAQKKPVMIDFYTDWCSACKVLDRDTYTDPQVIAESKHFVTIKVNAEKRTDLRDAYGITGFPTIVWANYDGKPFGVLPGAIPAKEFTQILQAAKKEADNSKNAGTSL